MRPPDADAEEVGPRPQEAFRLTAFLTDTAWYGLARLGYQLTALLGVALFSRWLSPDDFGAYAVLTTITTLATAILSTAFVGPIFPLYYDLRPEARRRFLGSLNLLATTAAALICALAAIASGPLSRLTLGAPGYELAFLGFQLQIFAITALQVPLQVLRLHDRTIAYAAANVLLGVTSVALGAVGLLVLQGGVVVMVFLQGLGALGVLGLSWWLTRRSSPLELDVALAKSALWFGLPMIPLMVANWAMTSTDRIILTHSLGLGAAGRYAVAQTVARLIDFVVTAFNMAWAPLFFRRAADPSFAGLARAPLSLFVVGLLVLWCVLALFSSDLLLLMSPHAAGLVSVTGALGFGSALLAFYYVYVNILYQEKRPARVALNVSISAALNVGANVLLIPRWGAAGAALALLGSTIVLVVCTARSPRDRSLVSIDWVAVAGAGLCVVVVYAVGLVTGALSQPGAFATKAALAAAAGLSLWALARRRDLLHVGQVPQRRVST